MRPLTAVCSLAALLSVLVPRSAPAGPPLDQTDVPILSTTGFTLSENAVAVDPNDPLILISGHNTSTWPVTNGHAGIYWSTDGGISWVGNTQGPDGVPPTLGDPATAIGPDGRFYAGFVRSPTGGIGVSVSTDRGSSWTHPIAKLGANLHRPRLAVTNDPHGAFHGRVYLAWESIDFGSPDADDVHFTFSPDAGVSWCGSTNISALGPTLKDNGPVDVAAGPEGEVYVVWSRDTNGSRDEDAYGFNRSSDGGVTWETSREIISNVRGVYDTGIPKSTIGLQSYPVITVDVSGGPRTGNIYVVWNNVGVPGINTGDADIYSIVSSDRGATWSAPVRVNDDAGTSAQWFPAIACDQSTGDVCVAFYDRRDDPADSLATAYVARSTDGGQTWENLRVGDVLVAPRAIPGFIGGYMGDYIGIAAGGGRAYPVWGDERTTPFLAYVSPVVYPQSSTDPNLLLSAAAMHDTLLESASAAGRLTIRNFGAERDPLTWSLVESPPVSWASETPVGGTVLWGDYADVTISLSASGLAPGLYSTTLQITSNDPDASSVAFPLDLLVLPAPKMTLSPFRLDYVMPQGDQTTDDFTLVNAGTGPLDYVVSPEYSGGPNEIRETIGSPVLSAGECSRCRGNVYSVTKATHLVSFETYLSLSVPTEIEHTVYEGSASTGTFTRIYSSGTLLAGPATGLLPSPAVGLPLEPGKFYLLGVGWKPAVGNFRDNTVALPMAVDFGTLVYGNRGPNEFPAPSQATLTSSAVVVPQAVTTAPDVITRLLSPGSGSLGGRANATGTVEVTVSPLATLGVHTSRVRAAGNDPLAPSRAIDVTVRVVASPTEIEPLAEPPLTYRLWPVTPNPAGATTRIAYSTPRDGAVRLEIFDSTGRLVKTLVDGITPAGRHEVRWPGDDGRGRPVASGVYFLSMSAGDFSERVKLVVLH